MTDKVYKILVADDEPDVLAITARRLKEAGFSVVTAADGEQAVACLKNDLPDILVLDVSMPCKNGFEVLKELRTVISPSRWVPVIIVSAHGELEHMRQGFELQADHYLTKPCRMEELLSAVQLMVQLIPLRTMMGA